MQRDDNTLSGVAETLACIAEVDRVSIVRDSRFSEFGINSLSMIDLVVAVEDRFNVRIPDEEAERFETVCDMVEFLHRAMVAT